jgi:alanine-glyoxylate transaminase/serine-glyoxylate transaminase/serine-pyruvate transaminase
VPEGFDATARDPPRRTYGVAFGVGLGEMAARCSASGIWAADRRDGAVGPGDHRNGMADLGYPITLGSGVAAAQEVYRAPARTRAWRPRE